MSSASMKYKKCWGSNIKQSKIRTKEELMQDMLQIMNDLICNLGFYIKI
jgi:hypothetical protein